MTHNLKLQVEFADDVLSGAKCFDVRLNDRGFQKGHFVQFTVVDGAFKCPHPLTDCFFFISYVLSGWGIKEDYVVFGIQRVKYN